MFCSLAKSILNAPFFDSYVKFPEGISFNDDDCDILLPPVYFDRSPFNEITFHVGK